MTDYRDSIKFVCEEHDIVISKDKVEEINDALNGKRIHVNRYLGNLLELGKLKYVKVK